MALIDANKKRLQQNPDLYRRRQAIVEHPFGVIKRQWDFYYIMTKRSIQHASADVGMIFTAYNLRRTLNIFDKNLLKAYLKALGSSFLFFQRSFKAIFEHSVTLGLASGFLSTDTRLGLKSNKWDVFERNIYLKKGYWTHCRYSQWYWSRAEGESMEVFFQQSLFQIAKLAIFASFDDLYISLPYGEIYESKGICR